MQYFWVGAKVTTPTCDFLVPVFGKHHVLSWLLQSVESEAKALYCDEYDDLLHTLGLALPW